jgi:hypothetical protein
LPTNIWTEKPDEKVINADEAKREALKDFEESRNSAMHHSQLKAECYLKARNAVQRGETGKKNYGFLVRSTKKKITHCYLYFICKEFHICYFIIVMREQL